MITQPDASLGFRLAGVDTLEADLRADLSALLLGIQAQGRYGLVAIDEELLEKVPENTMKRLRKKGLPLVIPIDLPRSWGAAAPTESPVVRLIRKAIGYQIKLKR